MDVQQTIADLNRALSSIVSEKELLAVLTSQLKLLRADYVRSPKRFEDHIDELRRMRAVHDAIEEFCELLKDIGTLKDPTEAIDTIRDLRRLEKIVAGLPIQARINREIRRVLEQVPKLQARNIDAGAKVVNSRAATLEQLGTRQCPSGHPMVIRNGPSGHFWGCSRFPDCAWTNSLSPEESEYMSDLI